MMGKARPITMNSSHKPNNISFIICAAGKGERFKEKGFSSPKPLINLKGKTMLERSIESLKLQPNDQLIIISLKAHELKKKFEGTICAEWIEIEDVTGGQLETFLCARDIIKNEKIVIYNCDTYFASDVLRESIENDSYDGLIPCSIAPGDCWSFCRVDEAFNILEVTEKVRISEWASVGYYYFKRKSQLIELAEEEVKNATTKESFVAPLYQRYLELGLKLKMIPVDEFLPFGTVEQVENYWGIQLHELLNDNQKIV